MARQISLYNLTSTCNSAKKQKPTFCDTPSFWVADLLILQFSLLNVTYWSCFLQDASLSSLQLIKRKGNKSQLIKYFWRMLLRKKNCLYVEFIHTVDSQWIEYLKTWTPLNHTIFINYHQSQTNFWAKLTKNHISITQTIIVLNKFVFHPNNCLVPLQIWVIKSQL